MLVRDQGFPAHFEATDEVAVMEGVSSDEPEESPHSIRGKIMKLQ
jgi:hypothetical protein